MTTIAQINGLSNRYGNKFAVDNIQLQIPAGCLAGLIGPDGVGKSSLLALISGVRKIQDGVVQVLDGDMRSNRHRSKVCPRIAYMPQGLGKNLYMTLSVFENVDFFGRLFGQGREEREWRINELLESTGLTQFRNRPAGKLSGGMKQKLGLCCALIHDPELLILDEPTTGVDPLSRRQFWQLIDRIRARREGMSVMVATAYMEEAEGFDWLVAMDEGRVLATGSPAELMTQAAADNLDAAFIQLLPEEKRQGHKELLVPPRINQEDSTPAIKAEGLTMRFGDFTAVDHVSFEIQRGEIFGFLGSNGCGKTTTMKMLTGLLPATEGKASLFGNPAKAHDLATRKRVGFMTQAFSLYGELTIQQNLVLHARLFGMAPDRINARVQEMAGRFDLTRSMEALPGELPLGERQRLSLAVAMIHGPEMLILDEPTSGVDPVARDKFWNVLIELARRDNVTIFISTHFMNEAERCDRVSLMHAGQVLATDTPATITRERNADNLEEAFISHLEEAVAQATPAAVEPDETVPDESARGQPTSTAGSSWQRGLRRLFSYTRREALELQRDPVRLTLAVLGSALLMLVLGYGISMDVEDLSFAVLDRDQTTVSRDYTLNLSGSRYFDEHPPLSGYAELDQRMRSGELSLAIEIPPGFARDLARGEQVGIGAWIDGSMPQRAEIVRG